MTNPAHLSTDPSNKTITVSYSQNMKYLTLFFFLTVLVHSGCGTPASENRYPALVKDSMDQEIVNSVKTFKFKVKKSCPCKCARKRRARHQCNKYIYRHCRFYLSYICSRKASAKAGEILPPLSKQMHTPWKKMRFTCCR